MVDVAADGATEQATLDPIFEPGNETNQGARFSRIEIT
jgi:hypothetical protein